MNATQRAEVGAYLVLFINRQTNQIANARICSEPSPTCATTLRTEVLFQAYASTFENARDEVRAILREGLVNL